MNINVNTERYLKYILKYMNINNSSRTNKYVQDLNGTYTEKKTQRNMLISYQSQMFLTFNKGS